MEIYVWILYTERRHSRNVSFLLLMLVIDSRQRGVRFTWWQEILCRFRQIAPDGSECGCMKAIVLFSPDTPGLSETQPVEMLQDQAQCILADYVRTRYTRQPTRFGRLLLLLPSLRAVRPRSIELLLFRDTVGDVSVATLLHDMYRMQPAPTPAFLPHINITTDHSASP